MEELIVETRDAWLYMGKSNLNSISLSPDGIMRPRKI